MQDSARPCAGNIFWPPTKQPPKSNRQTNKKFAFESLIVFNQMPGPLNASITRPEPLPKGQLASPALVQLAFPFHETQQRLPKLLHSASTPVLGQRNSSRLNRTRLKNHTSKLHLIDDTTLTSLPFPPPPPAKKLKNTRAPQEASDCDASLTRSSLHHLGDTTLASDREIHSLAPEIEQSPLTDCDDTFEDTNDPIVLVEDYMRESDSGTPLQQTVTRQQSLANFKKRMRADVLASCISLNSFAATQTLSKPEDLEAIFGELPGKAALKHCTLCEKPLYEISSIISNRRSLLGTPWLGGTERFHEIVCSDCIGIYEQISDEICQVEKSSAETSANSSRLVQTFRDLEKFYAANTPESSKKRKFSSGLLQRLHHLNKHSQSKSHMDWVQSIHSHLKQGVERFFPGNLTVKQDSK